MIIFVFWLTNIFYFSGHHTLYALLISLCCILIRKKPESFKLILCSLLLFSLYACALFPISSIISSIFQIRFPSQFAQILISILFGYISSLFFQYKNVLSISCKIIFLIQTIVLCACYKIFSYSQVLFFFINTLIFLFSYIVFLKQRCFILKLNTKILYLPLCLLMISFISNFLTYEKKIYIVNNSAVWATDTGRYDTNDWTLKTSYSYSLINEFIDHKFTVYREENLKNLLEIMPNFMLYMTPTKKFNKDELEILDEYLERGGEIIFIADHTDLYGHARVINDFIENYGIKLNYDAIYNYADRNKKIRVNNMPLSALRPLTGCSIQIIRPTYVRSIFVDFISEKADYTRPNFFAEMHWTPDDDIGVYPFMTSTYVKSGVISICTDSTLFSNFSIFNPYVLPIIDDLFTSYKIEALISIVSPFLITIIFLIFALSSHIQPSIQNFIFIALCITSSSFYIKIPDHHGFYDKNKEITINIDSKNLYNYQPPLSDSWKSSFSNLLTTLPRFGIFPYYQTPYDKIMMNSAKLNISYNSTNQNFIAAIDDNEFKLTENFSDYRLGTWWVSIGISPYRLHQFYRFSNWIKSKEDSGDYVYPATSFTGKGHM